MIRICITSALAVLLTGCAANGPTYREHQRSLQPVAPNSARLILYRTGDTMLGAGRAARVKIDGNAVGHVDSKGFAIFETPAGSRKIQTDLWDVPGSCSVSIDAVAGDTYYFEVAPLPGSLVAGIMAGVVGQMAEGASSNCSGSFGVTRAPASRARSDLQPLMLSK